MENNGTVETNVGNNAELEAKLAEALKRAEIAEAEVTKQKNLKDTYAKENADYKRKAEAQMTEEEKRAKEWQEMLDSKNKMETELAQMKLEKECLANGFTAEESEKLIKGNFAVKDIAEIIKAKVDEAVKSAKAEMTKGSTSNGLLGSGSTSKETSYAETLAKKNFANNDELSKIKELYRN